METKNQQREYVQGGPVTRDSWDALGKFENDDDTGRLYIGISREDSGYSVIDLRIFQKKNDVLSAGLNIDLGDPELAGFNDNEYLIFIQLKKPASGYIPGGPDEAYIGTALKSDATGANVFIALHYDASGVPKKKYRRTSQAIVTNNPITEQYIQNPLVKP